MLVGNRRNHDGYRSQSSFQMADGYVRSQYFHFDDLDLIPLHPFLVNPSNSKKKRHYAGERYTQ